MQGFAAPPLETVRVGVVGLGNRGFWAMQRLASIPGVEVAAVADLHEGRVVNARKWLAENGHPDVRTASFGTEAHRRMLDVGGIDVAYVATNWQSHVEIALDAMRSGCHAMVEVPAAFTVAECWALVETSEKTHRHCMQLENCCYGEIELLALNLCRKGVLGEIVHGEAGYIHDMRGVYNWDQPDSIHMPGMGGDKPDLWRLAWNAIHKGNQYPTHGLGPVCQYMNINHGDRLRHLVSLESDSFGFTSYARAKYGEESWKAKLKVDMGDMNMTLVKTEKGRSILIEHNVSTPRPYTRLNTIVGTKGILTDYPYRVAFEQEVGDGAAHEFFDEKKAAEVRGKYMHPIWRHAGPIAETVGGHGGADFIMDLRWVYCLRNGLPLDMDVYDLATWCCVCELSEKSVRGGSCPVEIPDFTRGAWRTAPEFGIYDIDISKMPFSREQLAIVSSNAMEI